jgi:hypothetical protein
VSTFYGGDFTMNTRQRFQFSLSTVFVFTAVVAGTLGGVGLLLERGPIGGFVGVMFGIAGCMYFLRGIVTFPWLVRNQFSPQWIGRLLGMLFMLGSALMLWMIAFVAFHPLGH